MGASRACRSDDDHDGDSLHARRRRFSLSEPLLRPLFGIVMIFVGIVGANGSVIMPALFVDAGRQVAELGLFSSMMGAGGLLGIAIHASVGARISAQNWLAVAFCGSAVGSLLLSQLQARAGADVVGRARGTADRLSLSHSQRCHLQPHAARTSPGTRHGLGGDAVSLAHGYACYRRVCRPCWSAPGLVVSAVFAGLVALLSLRLQFATMAAAATASAPTHTEGEH